MKSRESSERQVEVVVAVVGRERMVAVVGFGNLPIQGRLIVAVSAAYQH